MADPVFAGNNPSNGSTQPPEIFDLYADFSDADGDLDPNTFDFSLTDPDSNTIDVVINGVFQPGYSGILEGSTSYLRARVPSPPLFKVGLWRADVYIEDVLGGHSSGSWTWTVESDPPMISKKKPAGVTTELKSIGFLATDNWGIDVSSMEFEIVSALGKVYPIVSGGVIQPPFSGVIIEIDDPGTGPKHVELVITEFEIPNAQIVTINLSLSNIVGEPC
jgi:hypothetical protein